MRGWLGDPAARGDRRGGDADRQTLRPARRLLAGRDLGDRRRGGDQPAGSEPARRDAPRPQPRRRPHPGRRRRRRRSNRNRNPNRRRRRRTGRPGIDAATGTVDRPERADAGTGRRPGRNRAGSRADEPAPEEEAPAEEAEPAPPPKPEAGPDQTRLPRLAGQLRLRGRLRQGDAADALPERDAASQGPLLTNYSVLSEAITPNGIAAISGQPPNKATEADCPDFNAFPSSSTLNKKPGVISGDGCVYPVETFTLADQLEIGQLHLARLHGRDGQTRPPANPDNCVYPGAERRRRTGTRRLLGAAQPVHPLPLAARPRRLRDRTTCRSPN